MHRLDIKHILSLAIRTEREFFPSHISKELRALYVSNGILSFAASAGIIFEPLYLYSLHYTIPQIMLFCAAIYFFSFLLLPLGGNIVRHKGFAHGMIYGSFFLVLYFIFLLSVPFNSGFLFLAIGAVAIQKALYWPGYHADFALFGQGQQRGRELSNCALIISMVAIAGPLIGGAVTYYFGFPALFILMSLTILISNIPLLLVKETFTPHPFEYTEAFSDLAAPKNRRFLLGYMGFGEELLVLTIWPLFMFTILKNTMTIGVAVALSTLVTALVIVYTGHSIDKKGRSHVMKTGTWMVVVAWFARLMTSGVSGVFFLDFFSRISKYIFVLPMLSGMYEHASHTSIMRTVVFCEMASALGKFVAALCIAFVFTVTPIDGWWATFVIAGCFTVLYLLLLTPAHPAVLKRA